MYWNMIIGGTDKETLCYYDGLSRLRIRQELHYECSGGGDDSAQGIGDPDAGGGGDGCNWVVDSETWYAYDGRRVAQERDGNNAPTVSYTRGNDLSSSMEDAGGIGGLLARSEYVGANWTNHAYYHADGNGNITFMENVNETMAAWYRYDPYGNLLASGGSLAPTNVYRSSSKEVHLASGMYYYLYRFYDPNLQRWINRDPIEEAGGLNLFAFADNGPGDTVDLFGTEAGDFEEGSRCSRSSDREGHEGWKNSDKHTDANSYGGKKGKPNMAGKPLTAAQKEVIKEQKIKAGMIVDPKSPMVNKGPKLKKAGFASTRLLGHVALVGAQATCAAAYKKCLDDAQRSLDDQLEAAAAIKPDCGVDPKEAIGSALTVFNLSAAGCATQYAICGLSALLPF